MVLTLGLSCLIIYFFVSRICLAGLCFCFLLLFYFSPSLPIRSGEAFSSVILSLFPFFYLFLGCSDGMEREACVCDHGPERSDLCAEIIIITIILVSHQNNVCSGPQTIGLSGTNTSGDDCTPHRAGKYTKPSESSCLSTANTFIPCGLAFSSCAGLTSISSITATYSP